MFANPYALGDNFPMKETKQEQKEQEILVYYVFAGKAYQKRKT